MKFAHDFWQSKTTRGMALAIALAIANESLKYVDQKTLFGCAILVGIAFIRDCIAKNGLGVVNAEPDGEADR